MEIAKKAARHGKLAGARSKGDKRRRPVEQVDEEGESVVHGILAAPEPLAHHEHRRAGLLQSSAETLCQHLINPATETGVAVGHVPNFITNQASLAICRKPVSQEVIENAASDVINVPATDFCHIRREKESFGWPDCHSARPFQAAHRGHERFVRPEELWI